jgi:hypothetical protein
LSVTRAIAEGTQFRPQAEADQAPGPRGLEAMREVGKLLLMVVATAISVAAILFVMNLLGLQPPRP